MLRTPPPPTHPPHPPTHPPTHPIHPHPTSPHRLPPVREGSPSWSKARPRVPATAFPPHKGGEPHLQACLLRRGHAGVVAAAPATQHAQRQAAAAAAAVSWVFWRPGSNGVVRLEGAWGDGRVGTVSAAVAGGGRGGEGGGGGRLPPQRGMLQAPMQRTRTQQPRRRGNE